MRGFELMNSRTRNRLFARLLIVVIAAIAAYFRSTAEDPAPAGSASSPSSASAASAEQSDRGSELQQLPAELPQYEIVRSAPADDRQLAEVSESEDDALSTSRESRASREARKSDAEIPESLTQIRPQVFQSPAGLLYVPSRSDGHRLTHVMQHARDEVDKPVHGVFEGNSTDILAMIDEAYRLSEDRTAARRVRIRQQNDRRVITADLQRRIGYVGGQTGRRQNHPECRFLRLVLEDTATVVTAYPTQSF